MNFTELLGHVGIFGGAVIVTLALLSVLSVGMIIEKHRRFSAAFRESVKFKPEFKKFLQGGDVQNLIEAARQHQNSYVAQVVSAGIIEYEGVTQSGGDPGASIELITSALRDSLSETLIQLKQGLGFLATIGSTAPFVGLFGTVVGIINAFFGASRPQGLAGCLWFRAASLRPWSRRPWVSSSHFRPLPPSTTSRARWRLLMSR